MNSLAVHFSKDCKIYESTGKKYCSTFHIQWNLSFRMKRRKQDTMLEVTDKWDCYVIKSVKRRHFPPCNNGQRSLHALNVVSGNKKDQSNFSLSIQGGNNRIYKSFILNNGYWQCKGIFHHSIDCVMFCKKERNWFLSGGIVKAPNITPKKSISSDNINFCFSERPQLAWVSKHCYPKVSQSNIFKWRAVCRLCLG